MAEDTIRELIIADICTALADITTSEGYNSNIGQYVARTELHIQSADIPAVSVFPGIETTESRFGKENCAFQVKLQAFSTYDHDEKNSSAVQEQMLGDLIRRMTNPAVAETVSTYIDSIRYVSGGPEEYPESDETVTSTTANFEIKYKYLIGNPYQQ